MLKELGYRSLYLLILCMKNFVAMVFFIFEIIRYPIKNISIWLVGVLFFLIYGNVKIEVRGDRMFLMSLSLVSIMIFIANFLEKQTIDIENIDNFYLGYNIKKLKFHNNFWLKRFNEFPVKLLFWTISIIPIISICSGLEYNSEVLKEIFRNIELKLKYINSIWLATFIVCSFYCAALLIELVSLSSKIFSQSYLYKTTHSFEEFIIEREIEYYFRKLFNGVFKFQNIYISEDLRINAERTIDYIINRGNAVSSIDVQIIEFYNIAFECEGDKIDKLLEKVYSYVRPNINIKNNSSLKAIQFKRIMKALKVYYNTKWNTLGRLDVLPLGIVNIAIQDLHRLLEVENKLHLNKEYKNIFFGQYKKNVSFYLAKGNTESNLCISRIHDFLEEKFRDIKFLKQVNDIDLMMRLFFVLHKIDQKNQGINYLSPIFKSVYKYCFGEVNKDSNFTKIFRDEIKRKDLQDWIIREVNKVNKDI